MVERPVRRFRKVLGIVAACALLLVLVAVARSAAVAALTKSKRPFVPHAADVRVRYEPGAERFADALAPFLDTAVQTVEAFHGHPFPEAFEVFVCATQQSLDEFAGLPPGLRIRGTVVLGDVFIAPSAFDWEGLDTHRQSLMHELAHLYLRQRLGFVAQRKNVPPWFQEALADLVAGSGGEGISDAQAAAAILGGRALAPDSTGALFSLRRAGSYGLPGPMLHKQSTMFLSFIRDADPGAFERFLQDLQEERTFAAPFRRHFGAGVDEMWRRFEAALGGPAESTGAISRAPGRGVFPA